MWNSAGPLKNPVVVAKPISDTDINPAVIRIRNVDANGFEIFVKEWDYLGGWHRYEPISYIVMESGNYELEDGTRIEAGWFDLNGASFETVAFAEPFNVTPVVAVSTNTVNEEDAVTCRLKDITQQGFAVRMQEQEKNADEHVAETVSYIAWEPSSGTIDGIRFEVAKTEAVVTNQTSTLHFNQSFGDLPMVVADMQTTNDSDTANIRWNEKTPFALDVWVAEEESGDIELEHAAESVGYMAFSDFDPATDDSDGDSLSDDAEMLFGTDPDDADSDSDGLSDGEELAYWGKYWYSDFDGDGVINLLDADSDGDGVADGQEIDEGTDPALPPSGQGGMRFEVGEVKVNHSWTQVRFDKAYADPAVVVKSIGDTHADPAVIRVRNLDGYGFELRIQEWDYLGGWHKDEPVSYMVMESGSYELEDGTKVEAGRFDTGAVSNFSRINFARSFKVTPVVFASTNTFNESDAVTCRLRKVSTSKFEIKMQEQEANAKAHAVETISYIAWEPSSGEIDGMRFEVKRTGNSVTHKDYHIGFGPDYDAEPVFLSDMQTTDGGDTANMRCKNKTASGVDVWVDEEGSKDSETKHTSEVVGYMTFF